MAGRLVNLARTGLVALALGASALGLGSLSGCSEKGMSKNDYLLTNSYKYSDISWTRPAESNLAYPTNQSFFNNSGIEICKKIPAEEYKNGDPVLTRALNQSDETPVLVYLFNENDTCFKKMKSVIKILENDEELQFPIYNVRINKDIERTLGVNSRINVLLLQKGYRTIAGLGEEIESGFYGRCYEPLAGAKSIKRVSQQFVKKE